MSTLPNIPAALVVGAGPTGLTMAAELARHGLRPRIVDKAPQPSQTSKALGVQARTLELFERFGIVDQALANGRKIHGIRVFSQRQPIVHVKFDRIESRYNFVLVLPQSVTERLLTERLESLGITVERGVELAGFRQEPGHVEATLRRLDGGEETVQTPWLIGCDGAHSTVRHVLAVPFHGHAFEESFSLADVRLDGNLPDEEISIFLSSGDIVALFPMPGERRFRVVIERHQGPPLQGEPALADFQQAVDDHSTVGARLSDPVWMSHFRISQRQVEWYRRGHAFLAGDAAHIHSPVGGQGMNTGIQDAANLAWKLALVQAGRADEKLLDSYDMERRPVGRRLLQATGLMSQVILLRHPVADKLRDLTASLMTSLDVVQDKLRDAVSEVGVHYRSSPIVSEHRAGDWRSTLGAWWDSGPRAGDRAPDAGGLRSAEGRELRIFELLSGTRHVLLLFVSSEGDQAASRARQERLAAVSKRYGELIDRYTVLPPDGRAAVATHDSSIIVDAGGELHRVYKARGDVLFLVRPDGYLAFRSEPAEPEKLEAYLAMMFKPDAQPPIACDQSIS